MSTLLNNLAPAPPVPGPCASPGGGVSFTAAFAKSNPLGVHDRATPLASLRFVGLR